MTLGLAAAVPTVLAEAAVDYTLALALFDGVPVILSAVAYWTAAQLAPREADAPLVRIAALAVALGGTAKVTWKVIIASTDVDVTWLDDLLFPFLAVGLILLAGLLAGRDRTAVLRVVGGVLGAAALVAIGISSTLATLFLLVAVTAASVGVTVSLVRMARAWGRPLAGVLAGVNLAVSFVMAGFARLEQTTQMQWIEEALNSLSQASLLVCVVLLVAARATSTAARAVDHASARQIAF